MLVRAYVHYIASTRFRRSIQKENAYYSTIVHITTYRVNLFFLMLVKKIQLYLLFEAAKIGFFN